MVGTITRETKGKAKSSIACRNKKKKGIELVPLVVVGSSLTHRPFNVACMQIMRTLVQTCKHMHFLLMYLEVTLPIGIYLAITIRHFKKWTVCLKGHFVSPTAPPLFSFVSHDTWQISWVSTRYHKRKWIILLLFCQHFMHGNALWGWGGGGGGEGMSFNKWPLALALVYFLNDTL